MNELCRIRTTCSFQGCHPGLPAGFPTTRATAPTRVARFPAEGQASAPFAQGERKPAASKPGEWGLLRNHGLWSVGTGGGSPWPLARGPK